MYFYGLIVLKSNFSQAPFKVPEDGPGGPKHVEANIRYFNVNFNSLYRVSQEQWTKLRESVPYVKP